MNIFPQRSTFTERLVMHLSFLQRHIYFVLVVSVLCTVVGAIEHVTENVRVEGTISAGADENFVVTSQVDWNKYQFSFLIVT